MKIKSLTVLLVVALSFSIPGGVFASNQISHRAELSDLQSKIEQLYY